MTVEEPNALVDSLNEPQEKPQQGISLATTRSIRFQATVD